MSLPSAKIELGPIYDRLETATRRLDFNLKLAERAKKGIGTIP